MPHRDQYISIKLRDDLPEDGIHKIGIGDLDGDGELRVYTTVIPAADRRVCLMQDPLYRIDVALKFMGDDQIPMTSYYLGSD